MDNKKTFQI